MLGHFLTETAPKTIQGLHHALFSLTSSTLVSILRYLSNVFAVSPARNSKTVITHVFRGKYCGALHFSCYFSHYDMKCDCLHRFLDFILPRLLFFSRWTNAARFQVCHDYRIGPRTGEGDAITERAHRNPQRKTRISQVGKPSCSNDHDEPLMNTEKNVVANLRKLFRYQWNGHRRIGNWRADQHHLQITWRNLGRNRTISGHKYEHKRRHSIRSGTSFK